MFSITPIKDIDNMLMHYVRQIQEIDNSRINNQIKSMKYDNRIMFNFYENIIYYDHQSNGKYMTCSKVMMPCCCKKCGNYMNRLHNLKNNLRCKCNE